MGYFIVAKHNVLFTQARFSEMTKIFQQGMTGHEMMLVKISVAEAVRYDNFLQNSLNREYECVSEQEFIKKWVDFEIIGFDAVHEAPGIIQTYLSISRNGDAVDLRSNQAQNFYSVRINMDFPEGNYFGIRSKIETSSIFQKITRKPRYSIMQIDLSEILRIHGNLKSLQIETKSTIIELAENILIKPK